MLVKWYKAKPKYWKHKALINGLGLIVSAITLVIIVVSKFLEGAWIICIVIPIIVFIMCRIKEYYNIAYSELKIGENETLLTYKFL